MLTVEVGDPSEYSCAYWVLRASREIPSRESPPVPITVIAPLPAPRLTATPAHPVYVVGEAMALTCSIPGAPTLATVQFSKDGGELPSPLLSSSPTLQLTRVGTGHARAYSCRYRKRESGREISSPHSGAVAISVLVPPTAPQLSVSPSHPGYISGDSITLTCSAPGGHTLSRIQFLKDGQNLDSQMPGPDPLNLSRALQLPPLAPSHSGAYSCGYWFLESGREIPSGPSHPVHILVLEPPPSPWLTLAPQHPVYVPGERVTLRCSAPQGEGVAGYRFYRQRGGLIADGVPEPTGGARLELRAETRTAGLYVCVYWTLRAGREVPSRESRPVSVSMTGAVRALREWGAATVPAGRRWDSVDGSSSQQHERCHPVLLHLRGADPGEGSALLHQRPRLCLRVPGAGRPSLRLIPPLLLYVTGETVTAECVVPAGPYVPWAHWVLRDGEALPESPEPRFPLNVTPSDSGTYRCGYSPELHGRHLRSPPSEPVPVNITNPPPQPALTVDPLSGVVSEGLPLLITCMASGNTSERKFHFYKDRAEIVPGDTESEISTTEPSTSSVNFSVLSIPRAGPSNTGEFTCGYEANMSGRWIPSPRSQAVNVTVTAWSLPIPLVAGCGGAATALALLLLLICLCRKKAAATRRLSTTYWKSQELRRLQIARRVGHWGSYGLTCPHHHRGQRPPAASRPTTDPPFCHRRSADISGVNMCLQQTTEGGWPQAAFQD